MPDRDRPLAGYPADDGPRHVETITTRHDGSGLEVEVDVFADHLDEAYVFVVDEHVRAGAWFRDVPTPLARTAVFADRAAEAVTELQFTESITVSGVRVDVYADHFHDQFLFLVNGQVGACQAFDGIKGDHDRVLAFLQAAASAFRTVSD